VLRSTIKTVQKSGWKLVGLGGDDGGSLFKDSAFDQLRRFLRSVYIHDAAFGGKEQAAHEPSGGCPVSHVMTEKTTLAIANDACITAARLLLGEHRSPVIRADAVEERDVMCVIPPSDVRRMVGADTGTPVKKANAAGGCQTPELTGRVHRSALPPSQGFPDAVDSCRADAPWASPDAPPGGQTG
jgi:hypothetical protein